MLNARFAIPCALAGLLAASPRICSAQVTLHHDHRHLELSANGAAGKDMTCDEVAAELPEKEFSDQNLDAAVGCSTPLTSSAGQATMRCITSASRLQTRGDASAHATRSGKAAAASAFATSHYIMIFEVDEPTEFRFSGRMSAHDAEVSASLRHVKGGQVVISRQLEGGAAIFRIAGTLAPGEYLLEVESAARAATQGEEPGAASAAHDALFLSAPGAACPADHNLDGSTSADDITGFLTDYFSAPSSHVCDLDGSGQVDPDDLSDFVVAYFIGC